MWIRSREECGISAAPRFLCNHSALSQGRLSVETLPILDRLVLIRYDLLMTQSASTKVITAHVSTELADQIDGYAAELDRSRAWVVKQALSAWVEQENERRRLTLEGLADIRAGRTVEHGEVHRWAQSLGTAQPLPVPKSR